MSQIVQMSPLSSRKDVTLYYNMAHSCSVERHTDPCRNKNDLPGNRKSNYF